MFGLCSHMKIQACCHLQVISQWCKYVTISSTGNQDGTKWESSHQREAFITDSMARAFMRSPENLIFPLMKAVAGFISLLNICRKTSFLTVTVTSGTPQRIIFWQLTAWQSLTQLLEPAHTTWVLAPDWPTKTLECGAATSSAVQDGHSWVRELTGSEETWR